MSALYDEFADFLRAQSAPTMQDFIRGQRAKLDQLAPGAHRFTLAVKVQSATLPVFDFVCFGLDANGQLSDDRYMVFFNQRLAPDDAIQLNELADKSAQFAFDLDKLPPAIERLVFTLSIDGVGAMSALGASELTLRSDQPLMRYRFSGTDFSTEGALMLAEIYRKSGEWRAWASGQGFAGDLGALLKHFGGETVEDAGAQSQSQSQSAPASAPSASTTVPSQSAVPPASAMLPTPPSPPVSSPAISSVPINAPMPTVIPAAPLGELQQTIDGAPVGATIQLPRGEYRGPITLNHPLTIEGEGAVIWAQSGPVVAVKSAGVTLRGIQIEATGDENDVALEVEGAAPQLHNVGVRGRVVGVTNEAQGDWNLPTALDLGEFAPRALNSWVFAVEVPVDCRIKTGVSGLQVTPAQIGAGPSQVQIEARNIGPDTFLAGQIEVEHAGIVRPIPLSGRTASAEKNVAAASGKRL